MIKLKSRYTPDISRFPGDDNYDGEVKNSYIDAKDALITYIESED